MSLARREFLLASAGALAAGLLRGEDGGTRSSPSVRGLVSSCADAPGLCLTAGAWRPWFPWEQIAWVRTPWSDALFPDFVWLDFPEAVFTREGLWFLSHVNPDFPAKYSGLPASPWRAVPGGVAFERQLPNGLAFSGRVVRAGEMNVDTELTFSNGSRAALTDIRLQTCCLLKPSGMFSQPVQHNKYVHTAQKGWLPLREAATLEPQGRFSVGWRGGPRVSDRPWIVTRSSDGKHWVAMTWFGDRLSFIGNPAHPCFHADPALGTLKPQERKTIRGRLSFFAGASIEDFPLPREAEPRS